MKNQNFKIGDKVRVIATQKEISIFGGELIEKMIQKSNMRIIEIRDQDLIFDGFWLPDNFCMIDATLSEIFKIKSFSLMDDLSNQIKNIIINDEAERTSKPWNETLNFDFDGDLLNVNTTHNHAALHFQSLLMNEDFDEKNCDVFKRTLCVNIRSIMMDIIKF